MVKSSQKQIDEDEKKILRELQRNSKESIDNIAKNCGFSRQKVWRVIKRLEKNKTIWGYGAVVDDEKLDLKQYFMLVKRSNSPVSKEYIDIIIDRKVKQDLEHLGVYTIGSFYVHGPYEWVVIVAASDIMKVKKFVEGFTYRFRDYIADVHILEVIFPVQKNGISNPYIDEIREFF